MSSFPARRILLVDDDEDILPEYQEFLEFNGFDSRVCANPEQAIRMVLEDPCIGLVITDLHMTGLDGISLIRKARAALPGDRRLDFIILSGDTIMPDHRDIADIPVFTKPTDLDALVDAINSVLARV